MKRLILSILLLTAALLGSPLRTQAQHAKVEQLILEQAADEGVKSVFFERAMMQLMSEQASRRGDRELAKLLNNIRFIRVLTFGERNEPAAQIERVVRSDKSFQLVTATHADGHSARAYLRAPKLEQQKELIVFTSDGAERTVIHLYGAFDLHEVSRITSIHVP